MITFEPVTAEHAGFLYEICKERAGENPVNISFRLPEWEEHLDFIQSNPYWLWFVLRSGGDYLGYISVTNRNEIGIVLLKKFRGQGYGEQSVKYLLRNYQPLPEIPAHRSGHFLANINPANQASIKMFEKLGFRHIQNTYRHE